MYETDSERISLLVMPSAALALPLEARLQNFSA
jgi:hypothetical protein